MRKFILLIAIFSLLVIFISYPLSDILDKKYSLNKKQSWVLSLQENQYDYAALGSSRVYNTFDINTFSACSNSNGVNIGSSGSSYAENFLLLREFLKRNSINTLYLSVDEFSFNSEISYSDPFKEYMFLTLLSDKVVQEIFSDYVPSWKLVLWKWLPLTKYIEFNSQIQFRSHNNDSWSETGGTILVDGQIDTAFYSQKEIKRYGIDSRDEKYFRAILALCDSQNINTVLIKTPIYNDYFNNVSGNELVDNYVNDVVDDLNLQYFDYRNFYNSSNPSYFSDMTHTNSLGSIIYTRMLCESIFHPQDSIFNNNQQ